MKHNRMNGPFSARTIAMLESPAFRALSRAALMLLTRIEIEHAHHGGHDNSNLPVTFDQFVQYGVHRDAISPGTRELIALGFVIITQQGRAGNAGWRRPTKFRITYRAAGKMPATDEWRQIKSMEEAEMIAKAARRSGRNSVVRLPAAIRKMGIP